MFGKCWIKTVFTLDFHTFDILLFPGNHGLAKTDGLSQTHLIRVFSKGQKGSGMWLKVTYKVVGIGTQKRALCAGEKWREHVCWAQSEFSVCTLLSHLI